MPTSNVDMSSVIEEVKDVLHQCLQWMEQSCTSLSQATLLHRMADIVHRMSLASSSLASPALLKSAIYRQWKCSSMSLLTATAYVVENFGNQVTPTTMNVFSLSPSPSSTIGSNETMQWSKFAPLSSLIALVNTPSMEIPARIVAARSLLHVVSQQREEWKRCVLQDVHLFRLLPHYFDPIDIRAMKLLIWIELMPQDANQERVAEFLFYLLTCLKKHVQYEGPGRQAKIMLQILFAMQYRFAHWSQPHSFLLWTSKIKRLLMDLTVENLAFAGMTMSFMHAMDQSITLKHHLATSSGTPTSSLPTLQDCRVHDDFVHDLVDHVCELLSCMSHQPNSTGPDVLSSTTVGGQQQESKVMLTHYVTILQHAIRMPNAKVKGIVDVLRVVVMDTALCDEGDWSKGHLILRVIRAILVDHNTRMYFYDLADILSYIITHYCNVDVAECAQQYYSLLTRLSSERVKEALIGDRAVKPMSAENIIEQVTGHLQSLFPSIKPPVADFTSPVWISKKCWPRSHELLTDNAQFTMDPADKNDDDVHQNYVAFLAKQVFSVCVPLCVEWVSTAGVDHIAYPQFTFQGTLEGLEVKPWTTAYLDEKSCSHVNVLCVIRNVEPCAFYVIPSMYYTDPTSQMKATVLPELQVDVCDLALSMPCDVSLRSQLFHFLHSKCQVTSKFSLKPKDPQQLDQYLLPFLVQDPSAADAADPHSADDTRGKQYCFFFPPQNHLLLRVTKLYRDYASLHLMTDLDMELLAEFENFMLKWFGDVS